MEMESAYGPRQKHRGNGQEYAPAQEQKEKTSQRETTAPGQKVENWAGVAVVLGSWLRWQQTVSALWYDEAFSAWLAGLPRLDMLIDATSGDAHPPAYYVLLWLWKFPFGTSELSLRLPSLLAGMAVIIVTILLARAMGWPKKAALLAAGLVALAPQQIYYSSEARNYELVTLGLAVAALGLIQRRYRLAVVGSLLALYLHHVAGLFVGAVWLAGLRRERRYWLAGAVTGLLWLPNGWFLLHQSGNISGGYWMPAVTSPGRLLSVLDDLYWFQPGTPLGFATALVTMALLALLLADRPRPETRFLWIALGAPLLGLTVISLVWQPLLVARSMAPAAPFLAMLAAYTITRSRRRVVGFAAVGGPALAVSLALLLTGHIGRAPVDGALVAELSQYDAIYHANVGSYVVWQYYLPDTPQFVWPQNTSLGQTLSHETRLAMGMKEADFDFIKCVRLVSWSGEQHAVRRWAFIYFNHPSTLPGEMEFTARLLQNTPHRNIRQLRSDALTESWLVELTPECDNGK